MITCQVPTPAPLRHQGQEAVEVIEAPGHDPGLGVPEVEGVAELVEDAAEAGGHAAAHSAPVAAVVHQLGGVHRGLVTQPRLDTGGGQEVRMGGCQEIRRSE